MSLMSPRCERLGTNVGTILFWMLCVEVSVWALMARHVSADSCDEIDIVVVRNRELLQDVSCTFAVAFAQAATTADAKRGLGAVLGVRKGSWKSSGGDVVYTLDCGDSDADFRPPALPDSKRSSDRKPVFVPIECLPIRQILSRRDGIWAVYDPGLRAVNLRVGTRLKVPYTPFALGDAADSDDGALHAFISGRNAGTHRCEHLGQELVDGIRVDVIEGSSREGSLPEVRRRWYVDVLRGATPVRFELFDGKGMLRNEVVALKIEQIGNGAWVATRTVSVTQRGPSVRAVEINVNNISIAPTPRRNMYLPVPKGSQIVDVDDMRSAIVLGSDEQLTVDLLAEWKAKCARRLSAVVTEQGIGGHSSVANTTSTTAMVAVVIALAMIGLSLLYFVKK